MPKSRDIKILNEMLGIYLTGVASHGEMTGINNLIFGVTGNLQI